MFPFFMLRNRGSVLPFVLGILLIVTILLTNLIRFPGGIRRLVLLAEQRQQWIYDAESALIAYQEGLPQDYFENNPWNIRLPKVVSGQMGPWALLSAEMEGVTVQVLAGASCDSPCPLLRAYKVRRKIYDGFRSQLNRDIVMVEPPLNLKTKSGNQRLFGPMESVALRVIDGDLSLNLDGRVSTGRFIVDGSVEVRGYAEFDTLRVYARGPLVLRGQTKVRWLEAFSESRVEIYRNLDFSGVVVARQEVSFPNGSEKVRFRYPSFVMALENYEMVGIDSMLLPDFAGGRIVPFEWNLR